MTLEVDKCIPAAAGAPESGRPVCQGMLVLRPEQVSGFQMVRSIQGIARMKASGGAGGRAGGMCLMHRRFSEKAAEGQGDDGGEKAGPQ